MPIAMMNPASEVRFSPTSSPCMISSVPPIVKSSELPISRPARNPMIAMISRITIATDSSRFTTNARFASAAIRFSG